MPSSFRRWLLILAGLLLASLVIFRLGMALKDRLAPPRLPEAPPRLVEAIRIQPTVFEDRVPISGTLHPLHAVDVHPKQGGQVMEVFVRLGDHVEAGQRLARLEAVEYSLQVRQAEAALAVANEAAALAERSLERLESVDTRLGEGALAPQDLEEARVEVEGAQTQAELARLQRDLARRMVENATLKAPVAGVLTRVEARIGDMVGTQLPLFRVEDASGMELRAELGASEMAGLAPGAPVRLHSDDLPGVEILGELIEISPSLDPWTRRAPVTVRVPEPPPDLPGHAFARGTVLRTRVEDALVLPLEAVEREGDQARVVRVRDGVAEILPVEVLASEAAFLMVDGLSPGDLVVLPGAERLSDGDPLEVVLLGEE